MARDTDQRSEVDDLELSSPQGKALITEENVIDLFEAVDPWGPQQKSFVFKVMCTVAFCAGMHLMLPLFLTLEPPRFPKCPSSVNALSPSICNPKVPLPFTDCNSPYSYWYDGASIVTEFDMIPTYCDKNPFKTASWTTMIFAVGYVVGSWLLGSLGDALGRRSALLIGITLTTVAGFCSSVAGSVAMFSVGRFVVGVGIGGSSIAAYVLACELASTKQRPMITILFSVNVCLGGAFTAGLGAVNPNWRWLSMLTCAIGILQFAAFASRSNVESPRWQASNQQEVKAWKTFRKIAQINKRVFPPTVLPSNIMYHLVSRQTESDVEKQAQLAYVNIEDGHKDLKSIELESSDSSEDGLDDEDLFYKGPPTGDGFFRTFNTWPFHLWIWSLALMWFSVSLLYFSCVVDIAAVREFELAAKSWLGIHRRLEMSNHFEKLPLFTNDDVDARMLFGSDKEFQYEGGDRPKNVFDSHFKHIHTNRNSADNGLRVNSFKGFNLSDNENNNVGHQNPSDLNNQEQHHSHSSLKGPKGSLDGPALSDLDTHKQSHSNINHMTLSFIKNTEENLELVEHEIEEAINNGTKADSSFWNNIWQKVKNQGLPSGKMLVDRVKDILESQNATQRAQEFAIKVKQDIASEFDFNQPLSDYYKNLRRIGFATMVSSTMQGLFCALLICFATCRFARRKASLIIYSLLGALVCFAAFGIRIPTFSVDSKIRIVTSVAVTTIAKLFAAGCLGLLNLYTFDLFPTTIRSTMVGFITTSGFIAGIVAPLVYPVMNNVATGFLLAVSAVCVIFSAGIAARLLPESSGWRCFETLDMLHQFAIQDPVISNNLSVFPLCCYEICFRVCCCRRRKRRIDGGKTVAQAVKSAMAKGAGQARSAKRKLEHALGGQKSGTE